MEPPAFVGDPNQPLHATYPVYTPMRMVLNLNGPAKMLTWFKIC